MCTLVQCSCALFLLHSFHVAPFRVLLHVALFLCCTHFVFDFIRVALFYKALFSSCTFFVLYPIHVAPFCVLNSCQVAPFLVLLHVPLTSRCTFLVLHSFRVALFSYWTLFKFHYFCVVHFSCCTLPCCTCFILHHFWVALFSCCAHFVLHFFCVALFSCRTFFRVALFWCCTFCAIFSCCTFLVLYAFVLYFFNITLFSCWTLFMLHSLKLSQCQSLTIKLYYREWVDSSYSDQKQRCSVKKVLLEISQNLQESTCARVSFLIKLQAWGRSKQISVVKSFEKIKLPFSSSMLIIFARKWNWTKYLDN